MYEFDPSAGCHRRQRIEVCILELRQLAILHEQRRQRVSCISELLEHARIGGRPCARFFQHRQSESGKKNLA